MTLDTFVNATKARLNQSAIGIGGPGEVDLAFLDSQKNQHKQNLK